MSGKHHDYPVQQEEDHLKPKHILSVLGGAIGFGALCVVAAVAMKSCGESELRPKDLSLRDGLGQIVRDQAGNPIQVRWPELYLGDPAARTKAEQQQGRFGVESSLVGAEIDDPPLANGQPGAGKQLNFEREQGLHTYSIDPVTGLVHIPVERAMDLLAGTAK